MKINRQQIVAYVSVRFSGGSSNTQNVVLEKSYDEYMRGFEDQETGKARRGFTDIVKELEEQFPNPEDIVKEADKKAFAKLFGEYLKAENILQNYDEFAALQAFQDIDPNDSDIGARPVDPHLVGQQLHGHYDQCCKLHGCLLLD
nr:hypothetical protein [Epibacterium ulvae]